MPWDGRKAGQPLPVVNHNFPVEHYITGRHKNLIDLPGFGGSSGKAVVFADQYAGANMGAKIQAAITDLGATGGLILVPPGAHASTATITVTSNIDIEFLPGATYAANGNWPAFTIDINASKIRLIRLYLSGSNNAAHTNNKGIYLRTGTKDIRIDGGRLYQFRYGIHCQHVTNHNGIIISNLKVEDCSHSGLYLGGNHVASGYEFPTLVYGVRVLSCGYGVIAKGSCIFDDVRVYTAGSTGYGFYPYAMNGLCIFSNCMAEGHSVGFRLGVASLGGVYLVSNCHAANAATYGFDVVSGGAYKTDIKITGCWATNCASAGFYFSNANEIQAVIVGNYTRCTATQAYAFKFGSGTKILTYVSNDASGFSTAAEYWHPDLDKGSFEIGHNFAG